ncbi:MAG TPA: hypothetical protein VGB94_06400 [Acidobacteriaceae bacterium]
MALLDSSCSTAWAAKKPKPIYQDGVLKGFRMEQQGTHCSTNGNTSGTVNAHTYDDGSTNGTVNANTSSTTSCGPSAFAFYTVIVGEHTYVLLPIPKPIGVFGAYKYAFGGGVGKNSVLYGLLPGTPIQMVNKDGNVYIKVGNRESEYTIVAMQ